ncbi:MAG: hypothetical protein EBR82_71750 [Caulobacteraceae bacterium]|nr:hypothetical protein [Caulobacteraceae bacterium]
MKLQDLGRKSSKATAFMHPRRTLLIPGASMDGCRQAKSAQKQWQNRKLFVNGQHKLEVQMVEFLEYAWDMLGVGFFLLLSAAIPILWRIPYEDE